MATVTLDIQPTYPFGRASWGVTDLAIPVWDDNGDQVYENGEPKTQPGVWLKAVYNSSGKNTTGGTYYSTIVTTHDHGNTGDSSSISGAHEILAISAPDSNNSNTNGILFSFTLSNGLDIKNPEYYLSKIDPYSLDDYYGYGIGGIFDQHTYRIPGFVMGRDTTIFTYCVCPAGASSTTGPPSRSAYYKAGSITIKYPNNFHDYIKVESKSMKHSRSTSSGGNYTVTIPIQQQYTDDDDRTYPPQVGRGYIDPRYYSKFGITTLAPTLNEYEEGADPINGAYGYSRKDELDPNTYEYPNPHDYSVCSTTVNNSNESTSISLSLPVSSNMYGNSETFYPYLQTARLGDANYGLSKEGWYYALDPIEITFDSYSYSANIRIVAIRHDGVTIQMTGLDSTVNLDEYYYISTTNASSGMTESLSNPTTGTRSGTNGNTVNVEGLTPNANNTRYVYVRSTATNVYYKVASFQVQTDAASYSCNLSVTLSKPFEATISASSISPLTNLDGYWYLSDTKLNSGTYYLADSERVSGTRSGSSGQGITFTGLTPGATYTKHAYVRSSASSRYYYMESITFTAFGASVNVWDEENQEWNTHISTVKAEDGSFKYCEGKVWDKTNNKWRDF